ncbi:MAG: hypothetical protein VKP70_08045 [Cyanobacteriota bacterium]|nr:hypothetical protein [Cyanobacteriota bacterium]
MRCESNDMRLVYHADSELVDDCDRLVQQALRQRLQSQLQRVSGA